MGDGREAAAIGRNWSGTEGGDRSSIRDVLTMELVPLTREVGIERRLQAAGRFKGSLRTHVLVHLTRPPAAVLVVPEVHVIAALDLLDPEATADLHGEAIELPLHKGNSIDRKSTRLNSSHDQISYAVFCLKKK